MKTHNILIRPLVTEKSSQMQAKGQYSFLVSPDATKVDVKQAIQAYFGVEVETVKTATYPRKFRQIGRRTITKRGKLKKATVTLKGKKTLDPLKIKEPKKK